MHQPSEINLSQPIPCLAEVDLSLAIADKLTYEKKLNKWQKRMRAVQQAYYAQQKKAIIIFEGWDASGKGGAIRRITEKLDPRGYRVYPIAAPNSSERSRHYLYRFQTKLPKAGTIAIFDRSYYGRVLVERIEGFATELQWQRAYQEINEFERLHSDDNVRIIKIFLHVDKNEQLKRFEERLNNVHKRWKLTEEDIRNRSKWGEYEIAINDMFSHTSTDTQPWHIIAGNHKWHARVQILKTVVKALEQGVDLTPPPLDPELVNASKKMLSAGN